MASSRLPSRRRWWLFLLLVGGCVLMIRVTGFADRFFFYPTRETTPPPADVAGAESVWFESADGTRLHGWFLPGTPPIRGSVLHVHGNAGSIMGHRWFTAHLPPAGFNVFLFDYRGYGQSEGRARRRGGLLADTSAALDALLARSDVDPSRLALFGQSLGGSVGLNLMAERPELRVAVVVAAFSRWRLVAANAVGGNPPHAPGRWLAALLIASGQEPEEAIARIDRPILLLHGTADTIVPAVHGERLAAAAPLATLHLLPGGDHNGLRESHPETDRLTIDFLIRHLGAAEAP